jgi:uncharacterized protein (DUF305 family)
MLLLTAAAAPSDPAADFARAMNASMDRMMAEMHVPSTNNVDRDFVSMMIPHHQGAIDMAVAELRYGTDPHLKRIAQGIIVEQQQEIAAMRLAAGELPQPSALANVQPTHHHPDAKAR